MRRLMIQCSCGERIQVPHSALGRSGLCPSCGTTIQISKDNATPYRGTTASSSTSSNNRAERPWTGGSGARNAPEDIRRRFAEGVDLYFAKRYSEALVIFNSLAAAIPHDSDIQMGQTMCLNALRKVSPMGYLTHDGPFAGLPMPENLQDRIESILTGPTPAMDRDFFKRFLYDKILHGQSDDVQLRAAELAAKILGLLNGAEPEGPAAGVEEPEIEGGENGDYKELPRYDLPRPTPFRRVAPDDAGR